MVLKKTFVPLSLQMFSLRQHIVVRTLCLLMAIHIFNCSIDAPDLTPVGVPEDLSYNEIETITEFVAEKILGLENFFEERDDDDSEDKSLLKGKFAFDSFFPPGKQTLPFSFNFSSEDCHKSAHPRSDEFGHQFLDEPNAPPPWRS